jgi:hypothetical protein
MEVFMEDRQRYQLLKQVLNVIGSDVSDYRRYLHYSDSARRWMSPYERQRQLNDLNRMESASRVSAVAADPPNYFVGTYGGDGGGGS